MKRSKIAATILGLALTSSAQAIRIENGIPLGEEGHLSAEVGTGGASNSVVYGTHEFNSTEIVTIETVARYAVFVDPGNDGEGFQLQGLDPTIDENGVVRSTGGFIGANDNTIEWEATSEIFGTGVLGTLYRFQSGGPIGALRIYSYLDADIESSGNDVFLRAAFDNPQVYILNNTRLFGVTFAVSRENSTSYPGGAADMFSNILPRILGAGQPVSIPIGTNGLQAFGHPQLGPVFGPTDIEAVIVVDAGSSTSTFGIQTLLAGAPPPGDSDGDGVSDITDQCPGTVVDEVGPDGCPIPAVTPPPAPPVIPPVIPPVTPPPAPLPAPSQSGQPPTVGCVGVQCSIQLSCNGVQGTTCGFTTKVLVRKRAIQVPSIGVINPERSRAARQVVFAAGVSNIPAGQTGHIKLKPKKRARVFLRVTNKKRIRGVMELSNAAGALINSFPVRIKIR